MYLLQVKVWLGEDLDHYYILSRFLICRMLTVTRIPYIKVCTRVGAVTKAMAAAEVIIYVHVQLCCIRLCNKAMLWPEACTGR
jgi:hypothetical protein